MSDLDQPATKRDLLEFATKRDMLELRQELRHALETLTVKFDALTGKLDAFWTASDRVQRLAFGMVGTAVIAIVAAALTVILRG
jgi:hypothetical protein